MPSKEQVINYAAQEARAVGLPASWFLALLDAESGFDPNVGAGKRKSSAGAIGYGQLMPGTARGLGVDPFNWQQNIRGSARYLKKQYDSFGTLPLALSAYNSGPGGSEASGRIEQFTETQKYVKRVQELEVRYRAIDPVGAAGGSLQPAAPGAAPGALAAASAAPSVSIQENEEPVVTAPGGLYLESLLKLGPSSRRVAGQAARFTPKARKVLPPSQAPMSPDAPFTPRTAQPSITPGGGWQRYVGNIEHVEGPSAPHTPEILQFVGRVGRRANTVLTPWPNERHSLTTNRGTPSAHGPGNAADIPAKGEELIRLGRLALIEAGADPRWANKQTGGLFNVGGYQVIFNTHIGGDHTNHVHAGLRG